MRLSFEAVEEQVSLEISSGELTRERLANSAETSSSPMRLKMQNGEHSARRLDANRLHLDTEICQVNVFGRPVVVYEESQVTVRT
jgi:hypothetical protein